MTEAQIEQTIYYIMLGIAIIPAIIISIIHEKKRKERPEMVNTKPYTWGYYSGWISMIIGGELIVISLFSFSVGETDGVMLLFMGAGVLALLGYGVIKRNAIAWILLIIISFNPVCWIINGIYLKNRWSEFKNTDDVQEFQSPVITPPPRHAKAPPPLPTKKDAFVMKQN